MQQFFKDVNYARVMWLFPGVFAEIQAYCALVEITKGNMDMRDQAPLGMKRKKSVERRLGVNAKGLYRTKIVKFIVSEYAASGDGEVIYFWFSDMEQIAGDAHENKGNGHNRAIGVECPGNDKNESNGGNDLRFGAELEGIMFEGSPREEDASEVRRERLLFHRIAFGDTKSFFYYTTQCLQSAVPLLGLAVRKRGRAWPPAGECCLRPF